MLALVTAAALAASAAAPATPASIADDYPAALAEARARQLPLVIEIWAPW